MDTSSVLLAIKPQPYQGQELFKDRWASIVKEFRAALQGMGFENNDSTEKLLLFTFNHPYAAITAILAQSESLRRNFSSQLSERRLPFQIILHLPKDEEKDTPYRNHDAKLWEMVEPDAIHISKPLKAAWESLMAKKSMPAYSFSAEGDGLFKIQIAAGETIKQQVILAYRDLPVQGKGHPCFYCGMRTHSPSQCPGKLLTMEHNGLSSVGYLPFVQLAATYQKVFTNVEGITQLLAKGVTATELRKNPGLMVFIGFLDIYRVYQPRFLWGISFSRFSKWHSLFKAEMLQPDNKNLQLGFDCLRVGKYGQAEEYLMRECQPKSPKRFSATVAMAMVFLEQRGLSDMRNYLELAKSLAVQPKEHIYIDLLLSRFYELVGEVWKARDTIKNITAVQFDCPDVVYRKLQIEAKGNFSAEAGQLLRALMIDQRILYMAALMDPALRQIQTKVEDLLSSQYGTMSSSAQDSLAKATNELEELSRWFDDTDPQVQSSQETLDKLQSRYQKKSYFDILDVEHQTKLLLSSVRQIKEDKLNGLYDNIAKTKDVWAKLLQFWAEYRYKMFFKQFILQLRSVEKPLQEAGELAKKSEGMSYRRAIELLRNAEEVMSGLSSVQQRMNWACLLCDCAISFAKKLAITEVVGLLLASVLVFGFGQMSPGHSMEGLSALTNDPLFQRKTLTLTAFLIAPLLALSWTIKGQLKL